MQQGSPGKKLNPPRNERYGPPSQPKLLSMSSARKKADKFAAKDDKKARVGAKKAIIQELNTHLSIRAQGLQLRTQDGKGNNPYGEQKPDKKQAPKHNDKTKLKAREVGKGLKPVHETEPLRGKKKAKPVGYTWDKEGHQKEIRIHFLARKYLALWRKHTYGKISPPDARSHYNHTLMRQVMQVWQEIWWSGRKGWKLNIRAEYHNRYRMWQGVFSAWRMFVMLSRAKKTKYKLAIQYAHGTLLLKCAKAWRHYIEIRRHKQIQQHKAEQNAIMWVKRRAWHQWSHQMSIRYEQVVMEQRALHFWAINLIGKAWTVWATALHASDEEKGKLALAGNYSNRKLILKVWTAWKNYRAIRKLKAIQKRIADRQHTVSLSRVKFGAWVRRWHRQVQLSQFDDQIAYKGAAARARRALIHWRFYVVLQHRKYEKKGLAAAHYRRHLLQSCLNCLHLQAIERRLKEMQKQMAQTAHYKLQLKRVWSVWLKKCEHSEELKLYTLTKRARSHYSYTLLHKSLRGWDIYCHWRRYRHAQYNTADRQYKQVALPRFFSRVKMFVEITHEERENKLTAEKFRREVLYAQVFYKWLAAYHLQLDLRMMNRMAILHYDEVLRRRSMKYWALQAYERLRMNKLQDVADDHNNRRLLIHVLQNWKEFAREAKTSRCSHHKAVRYYYLGLLRWTWSAWSQYVGRKQVKWRKQAAADVYYSHRVTSKVLHAWMSYHNRSVQAQSTADEMFHKCRNHKLRSLFLLWREYAVHHKCKRRAKKTWRHTLILKAFHSWRNYTALHAARSEEKFIRVQEIRNTLDIGKLRRAFYAWDAFAKRSAVERSLHLMAVTHCNRAVLRKALRGWTAHTKLQFRVQILHRQSMWLHNRRITSAFFRRWKRQYSMSLETRRKSTLALWHWSVALQRQAFYAWLEYAISRKRKELRIAHALEQRRTRLLRNGVTQWMKVAFYLASERSRYAQARHLEDARGVQQCVHRCAMHWRRWAADRARKRGGPPRPRVHMSQQPAIMSGMQKPTAAVGADLTSTQKQAVPKVIPEPFRARPRPRVPDYLRISYDVSNIAMETDKRPLPAPSLPTPGMSGTQTLRIPDNATTEEDVPRPSPPLPSPRPRMTFHPKGRPPGEESIVFPPSSEGEGESFLSARSTVMKKPIVSPAKQKPGVRHGAGPNQTARGRGAVLLPPSCFGLKKMTSSAKGSGTVPTSHSVTNGVRQAHPALQRPVSPTGSDPPSESSDNHSDIPSSESDAGDESPGATLAPLLSNASLQSQILATRDKLKEHHDLKIKYRDTIRQRDELDKVVRHQREQRHDDPEVMEDIKKAEELLTELIEETEALSKKIAADRPQVERLAMNINALISRAGLAKA